MKNNFSHKILISFLVSFVICFLLNNKAFAVDYDISEILEIANQNSANIKSAEYFTKAQKNFANQQKYWNNPTLSYENSSNQDGFSIIQTIPFYNKLQTKYEIENLGYEILEARRNNLLVFVKAEVFTLAYQYFALSKKIDLTQKRMERLVLVNNYLSNIALDSPNRKAQSLITKDRINLIKRDLIFYRNQLLQTWNSLNVYLNLDQKPNIKLKWLDESWLFDKKLFLDLAFENNLNLKEQKLLIEKYNAELSYAKIEQMPDFQVSTTSQRSKNSINSSSNNNSNGLGLSISVPLINRNKEKVFSLESKIKAQKMTYEFEKNQLGKMLENDFLIYEANLESAKIFPVSNIEKIILRLSATNNDFKKGILDFITYIELDMQEYQAIEAIINTQTQIAESYSKLMIKIGEFKLPKNFDNTKNK